MTTITEVIMGLEIFAQYGEDEAMVAGEHDIIYAGTRAEMTEEVCNKLRELGWHVEEEFECWGKFV